MTGIPDEETAKGIEQVIINMNGGAISKDATTGLTNKISSTLNKDWMEKGRKWLNENIKDWEFKLDYSKSKVD